MPSSGKNQSVEYDEYQYSYYLIQLSILQINRIEIAARLQKPFTLTTFYSPLY